MQNPDNRGEGQVGPIDPFPLFTIGHGTRTLAELIGALRSAGVRRLIDVRRFPRSRTNPQFNREALEKALPEAGIAYEHDERLGGRRSSAGATSANTAWKHPAFRAYADYMQGDDFWAALDDVLADARRVPTAVMCSETLWWRCHRRLIADAAMARGLPVVHIMRAGVNAKHRLSEPGRLAGNRVAYTERD